MATSDTGKRSWRRRLTRRSLRPSSRSKWTDSRRRSAIFWQRSAIISLGRLLKAQRRRRVLKALRWYKVCPALDCPPSEAFRSASFSHSVSPQFRPIAVPVEVYIFYKREASAKSVRSFLNELTEKLKEELSAHGIQFSDRTSFGDLYQEAHPKPDPKDDPKEKDANKLAAQKARQKKADTVRSVLSDNEWKYLYVLNETVNNAVHKARLAAPATGVRTVLCPADYFDESLLQKIAAEHKMVDDPSKLVVKMDDKITPPLGPAQSPKPPSPRVLGKPHPRAESSEEDGEGMPKPKKHNLGK